MQRINKHLTSRFVVLFIATVAHWACCPCDADDVIQTIFLQSSEQPERYPSVVEGLGTRESAGIVEPQSVQRVAFLDRPIFQMPETPKPKKPTLSARVAGAYKNLFYDNDFSYLNDPAYKGNHCGEGVKQIAGPRGSTLDLGGEFRVRYHSEDNFSTPGLGLTGNGSLSDPSDPADFWLARVRLFANWKLNDCIRAYGEVIHADMGGFANHAPRPIEVNRHDVHNLFVDVRFFNTDKLSLTFRPGRQELNYGAQRLISALDWANTRRTFDGFKMMADYGNWNIDGFWANPMNRPVGQGNFFFDRTDQANEDVRFYGVYATRKPIGPGKAYELYYMGLDNSVSGFSYHTIGSRRVGHICGSKFQYELEGGYQFGENSDGSTHWARATTIGVGRACEFHSKFKPTVWLWYDFASGDDTAGNGWHHMFPLAHKYNGFMDLFGRRNLYDLNAQFILPVNKRVKLLAWYHYFRMDKATTPSTIVMNNFVPAAANVAREKELGTEIDLTATITLTPRKSVLLGYSHFNSGDFFTNPLNMVPHRGDAQFFYGQYHCRF